MTNYGTNLRSPVTATVQAREVDESGLILTGDCIGVPPTTADVFAHGATLRQSDSTTGQKALWENVGSSSVPSWNLLGDVTAGEITLAENSLLQGNSSGVAAAVTSITLPKEGSRSVSVATSTTAAAAGGALALAGGTGATTGAGGALSLTGGSGGATNANGGDVVISGGASSGTGISGKIFNRSMVLVSQGAPAAKTTSVTLTAAEVIGGLLTANQGAAGAANYQLPLATDIDTALPTSAANDAFMFSLINISTNAAEDVTLTTNTGWTLVGEMTVESNDGDRAASSGRFMCRKTGAGAWVIYRLS